MIIEVDSAKIDPSAKMDPWLVFDTVRKIWSTLLSESFIKSILYDSCASLYYSCVDLLPGRIILLSDLNIHYDLPNKSDVRQFPPFWRLQTLNNISLVLLTGHTLDLVITRHDDHLTKKYVIARYHFPKDHYCVIDLSKPSVESVTYTMRNYRQIDHDSFPNVYVLVLLMPHLHCTMKGDA